MISRENFRPGVPSAEPPSTVKMTMEWESWFATQTSAPSGRTAKWRGVPAAAAKLRGVLPRVSTNPQKRT